MLWTGFVLFCQVAINVLHDRSLQLPLISFMAGIEGSGYKEPSSQRAAMLTNLWVGQPMNAWAWYHNQGRLLTRAEGGTDSRLSAEQPSLWEATQCQPKGPTSLTCSCVHPSSPHKKRGLWPYMLWIHNRRNQKCPPLNNSQAHVLANSPQKILLQFWEQV